MEEKAAIAKRFLEVRKNINKGIPPASEEEFAAIYTQLITGFYGTIKATGIGSELGIMINSFDSKTGNTRLFLFTPAREDQNLNFETAATTPVMDKTSPDTFGATVSYSF
ncbi:MAG: hypothetical protein R3E73_08000 [Porticoccaceae bacterium]|nr:hypothetical protein [Pseudomonadales bacterium]MCP5173116.1 hypothetical protein [Pseudomonadales bacterium]